MYRVILTSKYKKSLRKIERSGRYHISDIEKVVKIIASGKRLDARYKDHSLTGDMSEHRECHIKIDLLLIYRVYNNELILALINIGSHSDLF